MFKKLKNSIAIMMVAILLLPSLIRLEHNHEHFSCNAKNEKHIHAFHKECSACSFTFSVFIADKQSIVSAKHEAIDGYFNCYTSCYISTLGNYSFYRRGPPVYTIS